MSTFSIQIITTEIWFIQLVKEMWEAADIEEDNTTVTAVLPKPGANHEGAAGYRPIALINANVKLFATILYNKLRKPLDEVLPEEQNGFRAWRSTIDHIATLRMLRQSCQASGESPCFCYVDLQQAFDSIPRELVYRVLRERGLPEALVKQVEKMHQGHAFKVRRDGVVDAQKTTTSRGLKQGCPLSPSLFNIIIDHVLQQVELGEGVTLEARPAGERLERKKKTKAEHECRKMTHLLFADDIVLAAMNVEELQKALESMNEAFENYGLKMNAKKTKWQRDNDKSEAKLVVGGHEIERVEQFTYLGSVFD